MRRAYLFTIVTDWFYQVMAGTVNRDDLMKAMADDIEDLARYAEKKASGTQ